MDGKISADRGLDPTISLAVVLSLPLSTVKEIRDFLAGLPDVYVVISKVGAKGTLWITEREPPREGGR